MAGKLSFPFFFVHSHTLLLTLPSIPYPILHTAGAVRTRHLLGNTYELVDRKQELPHGESTHREAGAGSRRSGCSYHPGHLSRSSTVITRDKQRSMETTVAATNLAVRTLYGPAITCRLSTNIVWPFAPSHSHAAPSTSYHHHNVRNSNIHLPCKPHRRFSGDESFLKDPNAFNDTANTLGVDLAEVKTKDVTATLGEAVGNGRGKL